MIYASVYFTILYKDSKKLEKTRKYRKPMPVNQRVPGSSPGSGATKNQEVTRNRNLFFFVYIPFYNLVTQLAEPQGFTYSRVYRRVHP